MAESLIRTSAPLSRLVDQRGATVRWGTLTGTFDPEVTEIDLQTVANIHVLPWWHGGVVLVRSAVSGWELPGGTREPGENLDQCLEREVREEIGGVAASFRMFGVIRCTNEAPAPFRPHIPHPNFNILLGEVRLSGLRANFEPDVAEFHIDRAVMSLSAALDLLDSEPGMLALSRIIRAAVVAPDAYGL